MSQKKPDPKNAGGIHIGGNVTGNIVAINSNLTVGDVHIAKDSKIGQAEPTDQEKLKKLVADLNAELQKASEANKAAAAKVAERTEELVKEAGKEDAAPAIIEAQGNTLKKAADNIAEAMPAVAIIVTGIVTLIRGMVGF